jgi:hypothetical protein
VPAGERSATSSITRWRGQITCALRAGQQISTNEVLKVTGRSEFEPDAAGGGLTKWLMLEKFADAGEQSRLKLERPVCIQRLLAKASPSAQLEPTRALMAYDFRRFAQLQGIELLLSRTSITRPRTYRDDAR